MSACDRALARYREALGSRWELTDEILFRAAWNEAAYVARDRADTERQRARDLLERCRRELQALGCPLAELFDDIDTHMDGGEG